VTTYDHNDYLTDEHLNELVLFIIDKFQLIYSYEERILMVLIFSLHLLSEKRIITNRIIYYINYIFLFTYTIYLL